MSEKKSGIELFNGLSKSFNLGNKLLDLAQTNTIQYDDPSRAFAAKAQKIIDESRLLTEKGVNPLKSIVRLIKIAQMGIELAVMVRAVDGHKDPSQPIIVYTPSNTPTRVYEKGEIVDAPKEWGGFMVVTMEQARLSQQQLYSSLEVEDFSYKYFSQHLVALAEQKSS